MRKVMLLGMLLAGTARAERVAVLSAGAGARTLYHTPFLGGQVGAGVGTEGPRGAWYLTLDGLLGASESRLMMGHVKFGAAGEWRVSEHLRLGCGADWGPLAIRRATHDQDLWTVTIGTYGSLSADIANWSGSALYFNTRLGIEGALGAPTPIFDGTLGLGIRL